MTKFTETAQMNAQMKIPRYRTIKECLHAIKKLDDKSAITEFFIRHLCKQGKVQYFASGNKSLVNLDSLLAYLANGAYPQTHNQQEKAL